MQYSLLHPIHPGPLAVEFHLRVGVLNRRQFWLSPETIGDPVMIVNLIAAPQIHPAAAFPRRVRLIEEFRYRDPADPFDKTGL
jgi:hypothetical protein